VIFHETRHHAQAHVKSGPLTLCALSLSGRTLTADGLIISLATVCYGNFCWGLLLLLLLLLLILLLPQNSLLTLLASAPDSGISNQNFTFGFLLQFYFFPAIALYPQSFAMFRLLCMTRHSFRNAIPVRYERVLQRQQNRSKATTSLLYKNSNYLRVPKTLLLDWQLYVACYYPTTPTDYPSTTRGGSTGPPVAININFCGYLWFLSISFVWTIWVQYATDNLSGQHVEIASKASVNISTDTEP
jgi:hypothetical protein